MHEGLSIGHDGVGEETGRNHNRESGGDEVVGGGGHGLGSFDVRRVEELGENGRAGGDDGVGEKASGHQNRESGGEERVGRGGHF